MENDWLKLIVGERIWSARCQKRIDSNASRVELNFYDAGITLFLDSETSLKGRVLNETVPKDEESGWSNENYMVYREQEHKDNELIIQTFHKLWTAAVGTEKYNKTDWKRLENVLRNAGYSV